MRSAALSVDHLLIVILGMLPHDGLEMNQKTCREKRQNVTFSNTVFNFALLFFLSDFNKPQATTLKS